MIETLGPIAYIVALVAIAAGFLWLIDGVAKLVGGRKTSLLLLGVIPLAVSLTYSLHNWEHLAWWQRLLYPLSGPVLASALLFLGFAAINPADAVLLVGELLRGAGRWLTGRNKVDRRDD